MSTPPRPPPPPSPSSTNYLTNLGLGYAIAISLGFLVLLSSLLLSSYVCCHRRRRSPYPHPSPLPTASVTPDGGIIVPRIIFVAEDDSADPNSPSPVVGLDSHVIHSYPKFPFVRSPGCCSSDTTCSICLCEYRDAEMLRMMPECRHSFHLCCLDPWLKLNGSCPVCRNSPLPTPLSTPLQEVVPLSQYADNRRHRRFDRDWKNIEAFVGSKTVIQIRSHAQKYCLIVQKNNTSEHLPPPRPQQKAARPYPQKAPKGPVVSQENLQYPTPSSFIEPGCMISSDVLGNSLATTSMSAWSHNSLAVSTSQLSKDDDQISDPVIPNHCCSSVSIGSTPISWPNSWAIDDQNPQRPLRVMPDFDEVYRFIDSIFDPDTGDHLERLKEMDPINLEMALLLMRNLCTNLMSPAFEKHRKILGVYNDAPEKENSGKPFNLKCPSVILSA